MLLSASAACFSNPVFTQSVKWPWQGDLRTCACTLVVACAGWEWRSLRRGWRRHASRLGVGALPSELRGDPSGRFPPELPWRPRSGLAELPTSLPSAAARLCGSVQRGTWQTLPGRREREGGRGAPSGSPEGRLLPPLGQPPLSAPAPRPPLKSRLLACLPLYARGPPLSPARRRAPSGWGAWTPESRFGVTFGWGGRSRRCTAALEWRYPAAAIPAATGLAMVPTRTLGSLAPLHPAPVRARPPGSRSASSAFASASSTRYWAPRGTTWAPCASCSR